MKLKLEDGGIISPLEISNVDILKPSNRLDYLIQEYNYQLEASNLQPFDMREVILPLFTNLIM